MNGRIWILCGCLSAALAVGMGAFGAHGLENWLAENFPEDAAKRIANWKTAADYQIYHSLGLIAIGLVANFTKPSKLLGLAGLLLMLGVALFSGMLYGWVVMDSRTLVMIVPLGGLSFIVGWVLFGVAALKGQPANGQQTSNE